MKVENVRLDDDGIDTNTYSQEITHIPLLNGTNFTYKFCCVSVNKNRSFLEYWTNVGQLSFVKQRLIFVGPQYETCIM